MTLPAWPSVLPRPLRDSWQLRPQDVRVARTVQAGPPGYRRRFSAGAQLVSQAIDLDRHQKAVFDKFFFETTRQGSLPFTMPDPTTDGWALLDAEGAPILTEGGDPILLAATWTCLFGQEVPVEAVYGVRFIKSFSIAVMP